MQQKKIAHQARKNSLRRWIMLLTGERPCDQRRVDPALLSFARLGLLAYYR